VLEGKVLKSYIRLDGTEGYLLDGLGLAPACAAGRIQCGLACALLLGICVVFFFCTRFAGMVTRLLLFYFYFFVFFRDVAMGSVMGGVMELGGGN
jgi:hypothetical protein